MWTSHFAIVLTVISSGLLASSDPAAPSNGPHRVLRSWGDETEGFRLSIASPTQTVLAGDPVDLDVVMKNVAASDVAVVSGLHPLRLYKIKVVFDGEDEAPLTRYGRLELIRSVIAPRTLVTHLRPDEEQATRFRLNQLFDMTVPGTYEVVVSREVWKQDDKRAFDVVDSNILAVTVK